MRLVSVIVLVLGTACGAAQHSSDLMSDVRGYGEGLRWQKYAEAAARLMPAQRDDFLDEHEQLEKDLRIADYEITRVRFDKTGDLAKVQIEWTWLLDSTGIVHTTVSKQAWKRFGKRWIMTAEERLRGDPMPGVAEPVARPAPEAALAGRTSAQNP